MYLFPLVLFGGQNQKPDAVIQKLLPSPEETKPWTQQGESQLFNGDDLFLFINGGADIYHEYGFVQVLSAEFRDPDGHAINMEIFEMVDPASAFGIYSYKIGGKGKPLDLGNSGLLEDYFLNFWKGPYLVTLTSLQTDSDNSSDLIHLARQVQKKIPGSGSPPPITKLFPKVDIGDITYFKGNLGLMKIYQFHHENIFNFSEGVYIKFQKDNPRYTGVFVFSYKSAEYAKKNHEIALNKIKSSNQFSHGPNFKGGDVFSDKRGKKFLLERKDQYISIKEVRNPYPVPEN